MSRKFFTELRSKYIRFHRDVVKVLTAEGYQEFRALSIPGLAVFRKPGRMWAVVHTPTGRVVVSGFRGCASAKTAAAALFITGIPWTREDVFSRINHSTLNDYIISLVSEDFEIAKQILEEGEFLKRKEGSK